MPCLTSILGDDMMSLLFHVLDEFLFLMSAEPFFIARVIDLNCFKNMSTQNPEILE